MCRQGGDQGGAAAEVRLRGEQRGQRLLETGLTTELYTTEVYTKEVHTNEVFTTEVFTTPPIWG